MKELLLSAGLALLLASCGQPREEPSPQAGGVDGKSSADDSLAAALDAVLRSEGSDSAAQAVRAWTVGRTAVQLSAGRVVTLRAVRESRHPDFDRIVFDFGEQPLPNYDIEYVDTPQHQCGSGEEVRLKGDAWLAIKLQPVQAHDDAGHATVAERSREPALPNLLELRLTCDFEAHVEWIAGVASPNGYRVLMLQQPTRLVLDLKH